MAIQKTDLDDKSSGSIFSAEEFNLIKNTVDNNADELGLRQRALAQQMEQFTDLSGTPVAGMITKNFTLALTPLSDFFVEIFNQFGYLKNVQAAGQTYSVTFPVASTTILFKYWISKAGNVPITLTSLSISGSNSINEGSTQSYSVTGNYSDGTTQIVTSQSSLLTSEGTISTNGLLSIPSNATVGDGRTVTITASFGGRSNTKVVTVADSSNAVVPPIPTAGVVDDTANTFNWTNSSGYSSISDYEFTLNGGTSYTQASVKPIIVGNIDKAIGQVGVRVKAASGRTTSGTLFNNLPFVSAGGAVPTPAAPTSPVTDDVYNTFDWTNTPGFTSLSDYEFTVDGGASYTSVSAKPVFVGNVHKVNGQVGVRINANPGRNASATLYNTIGFNADVGEDIVVFRETWALEGASKKINEFNWVVLINDASDISGFVTVQMQTNNLDSIVPVNAGYSLQSTAGFPEIGIGNHKGLMYTEKYSMGSDSLRKISFWCATWQSDLHLSPAVRIGTQWYVLDEFKHVINVSNGNNPSNFEKLSFTIDPTQTGMWRTATLVTFTPGGPPTLLSISNSPTSGPLPVGSVSAFGLYFYNDSGENSGNPIKLDNYEVTANIYL